MSIRRRCRFPGPWWFALAGAACSADAAVYTVGVGSGCTHPTIAAALAAAAANGSADEIRITRSSTYLQQAIVIDTNQDLDLAGGYASCDQTVADGAYTPIRGAGGATEPVFRITVANNAVRMRLLDITDGDEDGAGYGGGIFFRGNGRLELADLRIANNLAGYGGGIYAEGLGPAARLVIGANVLITGNDARYSGGGIYVDGVHMTMDEPGSVLAFNEALGSPSGGFGGAIQILGGARDSRVDLGSRGAAGLGPVYGNTARLGGGISLATNSNGGAAFLYLYSTDATQPTAIRGNFASVAGGGIHSRNDGTIPQLRLRWVDIADNAAPRGAAIELDGADTGGLGSYLYANDAAFDNLFPASALPCPVGAACGTISGNQNVDAADQPTDGATLQAAAMFNIVSLSRIALLGNTGAQVLRLDGAAGDLSSDGYLRRILVAGNATTQELLRVAGGDGSLQVEDSTLAGNAIGGSRVVTANGDFGLLRSILWQPPLASLVQSAGMRAVADSIASETASLGGAAVASLVASDPRFVAPEAGDFRLRAASPAVDFAGAGGPPAVDLEGRARGVDLAVVPDRYGPRDIGAYERATLQPLVLNGDFDLQLQSWYPATPGSTTWSASNAVGAAGSGSARIALNPGPVTLAGAAQCVQVPGPGTYRLAGWGLAPGAGSGMGARDSVYLTWALRLDGGAGCDGGGADAQGSVFLGNANTWRYAPAPAVIEVPAAAWTRNTSILVTGSVFNTSVVNAIVDGSIDGVALDLTVDALFADSFE